jgi:hypothetical protein
MIVLFCFVFQCKLVQHTYSCLFGTFLCNSESERQRENVKARTYSVWSLFHPRRKEFKNILYAPNTNRVSNILRKPGLLGRREKREARTKALRVLFALILPFLRKKGRYPISPHTPLLCRRLHFSVIKIIIYTLK